MRNSRKEGKLTSKQDKKISSAIALLADSSNKLNCIHKLIKFVKIIGENNFPQDVINELRLVSNQFNMQLIWIKNISLEQIMHKKDSTSAKHALN